MAAHVAPNVGFASEVIIVAFDGEEHNEGMIDQRLEERHEAAPFTRVQMPIFDPLLNMYSKQEISRQKQAFWTAFGQYMQPVTSADGGKVHWVNYKTGVPGIHFRMNADGGEASIAIVLSQQDNAMQQQQYAQLLQLKSMLHDTLGEEWRWQPMITDEHGKTISSIGTKITGVNLTNNEHWPALISFFKQRIIALDAFWSMARYSFDI